MRIPTKIINSLLDGLTAVTSRRIKRTRMDRKLNEKTGLNFAERRIRFILYVEKYQHAAPLFTDSDVL